MSNLSTRTTAIHLTPVLFCLLLACAVAAQAQVTGYPGKIVCGFQPGNVPLLNDPTPLIPAHPYENFKPGNYATVFNVLNLNGNEEDVYFLFAAGNTQHFRLSMVTIGAFTSVQFGCDFFNRYLSSSLGLRFEGMLIPVAGNSNFVVDAVYTFESQNAFERHVIYEDGTSTWTFGQTLDEILATFSPPASSSFVVEAASGAGGLGLGASIDVERLEPVTIVSTIVEQAADGSQLVLGDG